MAADKTVEALALLEVQSQARQQVVDMTQAAIAAEIRLFRGWYSSEAITLFAGRLAKLTRAGQRQTALSTDVYATRILRLLLGRRVPPVGAVPVDGLRGVPLETVYARLADEYRWLHATRSEVAPVVSRVSEDGRDLPPLEPLTSEVILDRVLTRAEIQAEDNLNLAMRDQWEAELRDAPLSVIGYRRIIRPELSRTGTCGLCVVASDQLYTRGDLLPLHARCVPGDAVIQADGVSALTRRDYSGQLVVLTTASGNQLSVTPNHPVLTGQGWVPAHLISVGDDVVRRETGQRVGRGGPNEQKAPATIEQIWRSASMDAGLDLRTVPLASEDFYGDGVDGEVDVVATHGLLSDVRDLSFAEPLGEPALMGGQRSGLGLARQGGLLQALLWLWYPSHSLIRGTGDGGPLLSRGAYIPELAGLGPGSLWHSGLAQASVDRAAIDGVFLAESGGRCALEVLLADVRRGELDPPAPRFDPAGLEFTKKGAGRYASLGTDLRQRLAGQVQLDGVVKRELRGFRGHVYDLQSREGWFASDSYIVSNCRCEVMPVLDEEGSSGDPGSAINRKDLDRLYKAAGSTRGRALKKVRIAVREDGELGPILTSASDRHTKVTANGKRSTRAVLPSEVRVDPATVLANAENAIAGLEKRASAGEDVSGPLEYQRSLAARMRLRLEAA